MPAYAFSAIAAEIERGRETLPGSSCVADIVTIGDDPALPEYLSELFRRSRWTVAAKRTCADGVSFLRDNRAPVLVCQETLPDASWNDVAAALTSIPAPPALIVVLDDPAKMHQVAALGGFDVLVRPLCDSDAVWSVASAWHAWMKRNGAGGGNRCSDA